MSARRCQWCDGPIPGGARADSKFCGTPHRQAAHRAKIGRVQLTATDRPLRLAYADPPYIGKAELYRDHPDYRGEVDHAALLSRLETYDGWALSASAASVPAIAALSVAQDLRPRIAVWVRGPHPHGRSRILTAWEAVFVKPARPVLTEGEERLEVQVRDVLEGVVARRRPTLPTSVIGMKPPEFCRWVFLMLGARADDTLDDLYPGSGIVERSWRLFTGRPVSRDPSLWDPRGSAVSSVHGSPAADERRDDPGPASGPPDPPSERPVPAPASASAELTPAPLDDAPLFRHIRELADA